MRRTWPSFADLKMEKATGEGTAGGLMKDRVGRGWQPARSQGPQSCEHKGTPTTWMSLEADSSPRFPEKGSAQPWFPPFSREPSWTHMGVWLKNCAILKGCGFKLLGLWQFVRCQKVLINILIPGSGCSHNKYLKYGSGFETRQMLEEL